MAIDGFNKPNAKTRNHEQSKQESKKVDKYVKQV